ncbi:MAG TPA: tripartite tricarboxylate transporter substrate-binding protein [Burkholderiales bacterium]|nr:tripartite tricarboxylate transporter substrate-binding protein [Burkholderiales bacterium]
MFTLYKCRAICAALVTAFCIGAPAAAQSFPVQPIRAVVGYAAGGGADGLIRAIAAELSENLGQPVVIDNRAGGGTVIGTHVVAASKPDGYTIFVADNAYVVNPALMSKLPYDSVRDFTPIVAVESSSTTLLITHPSFPARSVKELIAMARASPGKLNFASGGNGTVPHVMGELLKYEAKINLIHVPYKSTGLAVYSVTAGEVPVGLGGIFAVKSLADSGRLRALALASSERSNLMPQVPSFKELGWPALDATAYRGLIAPAGTPRDAILKINAAANKALQMPAVRARFTDVGYVPLGGTPEDYGRIIRTEMEKWGRIIRNAGIKVE